MKFLLITIFIAALLTITGCGRRAIVDTDDEVYAMHGLEEDLAVVSHYKPPPTPTPIELTGFAADAQFLVERIEATHPIFVVDGWLGDDYDDIRSWFLTYAQNPNITRLDFAFAAARYITTLRDGHMNMALRDNAETWESAFLGAPLVIDWVAQGDKLFLLDDNMEITQARVVAIGGVPVASVFAVVDRYFYAENEADRYFNRRRFPRFENVINRAGGEAINEVVPVTVYENGQTTMLEVPLRQPQDAATHSGPDFIIRYEIKDDIFFIDLRQFINGDHITEAAASIAQAVADGISHFIVDLRYNGGGDSTAGSRLLSAMGLRIPQHGVVRRLSDEFVAVPHFRDYRWHRMLGREYVRYEPWIHEDANPNNVFVSVLTNCNTYSSATMMGVWVQDGGFGNIIGSPSRNAPSTFGNWIGPVTLPYSGIAVGLSSSQFLRPDIDADPTTLWPDIMVDPAEALDVAIEYLRNR